MVCHTPNCQANAFSCGACSEQKCLRLHRHEARHVKFMDQIAPVLDGWMNQQQIDVQKPDIQRLEAKLDELVALMHRGLSRLRQQFIELEASLYNQGSNGLTEKLHRRDGRDLTGNDVHILLTTTKGKNDIRKVREVESKMRMKYSNFEVAIAESFKAFSQNEKEWRDWQAKAKKYLEKGRKCMDDKKYQDAVDEFSKAAEMDSSNPVFFFTKGTGYYSLLNHQEAIKSFDEAILLQSRNSEYLNFRGNSFMFLKQFDKAISDYSEAIEYRPLEYQAYRYLGHAYFHKREFAKALELYSKVLEIRKEPSAEDFNIRGNCYMELKMYQEALEDYERAIGLDTTGNTDYQKNRIKAEQLALPNLERKSNSMSPYPRPPSRPAQ